MQALKHKYDIISYRSELTSEVTGLLNDFWGGDPEVNRAYLRWKHEDNPYTDRPLAFVAAHGGKVRGFQRVFCLTVVYACHTQLMGLATEFKVRETISSNTRTNAMTRTVAGPLFLLMLPYFIAFAGDPFLFIISIPIAFLAGLYLLIAGAKKRIHKLLISLIPFFLVGSWSINSYLSLKSSPSIRLLAILALAVLTAFLGYSLARPNKRRTKLPVAATLLVLFLLLLFFVDLEPLSVSESPSVQALKSLPYLSYVPDDKAPDVNGVVAYDRRLSNPGINIYNSHKTPGAHLVDMSGKILHTWLPEQSHPYWHYVLMYRNGDLLVSIEDNTLTRLDWNSNITWEKRIRSHHDIAIAENRDIYTLAREEELAFLSHLPAPILTDYIIVLREDGEIMKELSLLTILREQIPVKKIVEIYQWMIRPEILWEVTRKRMMGDTDILRGSTSFDLLHNNTITIINRNVAGFCKKGNILVSSRNLDLIGVVDIEDEELIWSWGPGALDKQHHPTLLDNGNILIFDNGVDRKYSRVMELDPLAKEIVWEYTEREPEAFFTKWGGAAQRLPNGNTLITESGKGRVFEIDQNGRIVWEFYNPFKDKNGKRATIYRMMRITDPQNYAALRRLQ